MNRARLAAVVGLDLGAYRRRPLLWVWAALVLVVAWLFGQGNLTIASGDSSVGGTKAFITSQFALAQFMALGTLLFHGFFVAIVSGLPIIRDHDLQMDELLRTTPLRRDEYVWGKYGAALLACLALLALQLAAAMVFNHLPSSRPEIRGGFQPGNYLLPALVFAVPLILFISGVCFALGALSRRPLTVFVLPVALLLLSAFLFWEWAPAGLSPAVDQLLMLIDPAGFRWLQRTWLEADRGVEFYNRQPVGWGAAFLLSRLVLSAVGLGLVALVARERSRAARVVTRPAAAPPPPSEAARGSLAPLQMKQRRPVSTPGRKTGLGTPAWLSHLLHQVRFELKGLARQSGLYLFVPVILLTLLPGALSGNGPFDSDLLPTAGTLAARVLPGLFICVALLLLFYLVESLERDGRARVAPMIDASPLPTSAWLLGRMAANVVLALAILLVAFIGCQVILWLEGSPLRGARPFLLLWGALGLPTILVWTAFVTLAWTVSRNRFFCYGAGLLVLAGTGLVIVRDKMTWLLNWALWKTVIWSDISVLEHDRRILVLNRLFMTALALLFARLALAVHRRREPDPLGQARWWKRPLARPLLRNAAFWLPALALGIAVWITGTGGYQSRLAERENKDYWRKNVATFREAKLPDLTFVDLDVDLEPATRRLRVEGTYHLQNSTGAPLRHVPLSLARHLRSPAFTLDGQTIEADNRAGLYVITPATPLAPGATARIGFRYQGQVPEGPSARGGRVNKFILPSSVMLASLGDGFVPALGWQQERGVDADNRAEPRVYERDFHVGQTESAIAGAGAPFRTRIRVSTPPDFTAHGVGVKTADRLEKGRRVVVWESDQPVYIFNVVAGRWQTARGQGVEVHHDPRHTVNVPEMVTALEAARRYYSQWFYPFPWQTLKLSEFAGLDVYAEGYPTNITFSENIGFLAKPGGDDHLVFWITAHEAAHQWWPNLVVPARGPGSEVLSEGMSHFSAMLLLEAVKGERARMEFARRIEHHYEKGRSASSEQPLTELDGDAERDGQSVVWYDRGGWAFWMLLQQMGRQEMFRGLRAFVENFRGNPDHPALPDLFAVLRPLARDGAAFDAFVQQWFERVTVPRFELLSARREKSGGGWRVTGRVVNTGTGRVPVDLAATTGQRFQPGYREARTRLHLEPDRPVDFTLETPFSPEQVVVDPDVMVLQLGRSAARRGL